MPQLRLYTRRNYLISRNLVFANYWKKISFYQSETKLQQSIIQAFQPKSFIGNSFHEKQDADFPIATIIFKNPYFKIAIYYCKSKSSCKQSYYILNTSVSNVVELSRADLGRLRTFNSELIGATYLDLRGCHRGWASLCQILGSSSSSSSKIENVKKHF